MDFSGKKVLVYGAGKSGIGAVNLLVKLGAHPVLFDEKPGLTGEQMLAGVDEPGEVTVCAGTLPENIAHALDLIVMSPGIHHRIFYMILGFGKKIRFKKLIFLIIYRNIIKK